MDLVAQAKAKLLEATPDSSASAPKKTTASIAQSLAIEIAAKTRGYPLFW
jgi:hypothetical protein